MAGPPEEQSTSVVVIDGLLTPPGGLTAFAARALDPRRSLEGQIRETRSGRAVAMATHPFKVVGRALKLLLWWRGQSGAAASIPRS